MELLQEEWASIRKKVIIPLWNGKFKSMYERIKMDYDDFESLAGIELTKAMAKFNPKKSNLFTYATNIITKKATTELRDCTQRDVRKTLHLSESVDAMEKVVVENIPSKYSEEKFVLSEKMMRYLDRLSDLQKRILFLMSDGFNDAEITKLLKITENELSNALSGIRAYRNVSLLY